jgi:hypothetical protein
MAYDPYVDLPQEYRPTFKDTIALTEVVRLIKECIKLRHDFHTAIHVNDVQQGIRQAFVPAMLNPQPTPTQRHLNAPPAWESSFAAITPDDRKTMSAFADEHRSNALEIKTRIMQVNDNAKLRQLLKDRIEAFIPDIGYSAGSGSFLRRLRKDDRSILSAFDPLGVGDVATLVKLLIKRTPTLYYYW